MLDQADGFAALRSSGPESSTAYKPRRAIIELPEPADAAGLDQVESPDFQPVPGVGRSPNVQWASPVGPAAVEDLGLSRGAGIGGALVSRELNRLRTVDGRWAYLNCIPGGKNGSEIGHLLIGPGGVFTINARHQQHARAWMGGDIRISRDEAQRAARLLTAATRISIRVRGMIVPPGVAKSAAKHQPYGVEIVNHSALVEFLTNQPPYLDRETRARIIGYARLSSTWSPQPTSR